VADREPPGIDWARIYVQAVNLAADVTKRDAQDVVNDAVALYLAGQAPYDPTEGKTLAEHLVHIGLTARAKRRRTERRRKKRGMMGKLIHLFDRPPPTSEERYADAEESTGRRDCSSESWSTPSSLPRSALSFCSRKRTCTSRSSRQGKAG
jgi:hypothetical protein